MVRKTFALLLSMTVWVAGWQVIFAQAQTRSLPETVRRDVEKIGTAKAIKIEAKLTDGSKVKGYISEITDDSFTVKDAKTGAAQTLSYTEVTSVKKAGGGLSPLTWGIIGGAAAAAVIVGVTVVKPVLCDGGAGC